MLVHQTDRRDAESLAEAVEGATPRARQRPLTEAPWPTDPVLAALQASLSSRLSVAEGIFVVDENELVRLGQQRL